MNSGFGYASAFGFLRNRLVDLKPFALIVTPYPTPENAGGGGASGTPFVSVDISLGMDLIIPTTVPTPENAGSSFISADVRLRT